MGALVFIVVRCITTTRAAGTAYEPKKKKKIFIEFGSLPGPYVLPGDLLPGSWRRPGAVVPGLATVLGLLRIPGAGLVAHQIPSSWLVTSAAWTWASI